ncbi:MAG: hypothetical protein ACR2PG_17720 [Hyphomicrobiaceae bacterium]
MEEGAQNERDAHASGDGGVPYDIFRGEPFWGHDRFETLVWRPKQNGLSKRWPPEGGVSKAGNLFRISAQLMDAINGKKSLGQSLRR